MNMLSRVAGPSSAARSRARISGSECAADPWCTRLSGLSEERFGLVFQKGPALRLRSTPRRWSPKLSRSSSVDSMFLRRMRPSRGEVSGYSGSVPSQLRLGWRCVCRKPSTFRTGTTRILELSRR